MKIENKILIILCLTFFVGIWHALPIKDAIADELYFVGGVFRALESHSFLPVAGDVPYGTLNYFLNYFLISFSLLLLLPFFRFSVAGLKLFVLNSSDLVYFYLSPRIINAVLAIFLLFLVYKIFKREIGDFRIRLFLTIILFTDIIISLILHTGKMWVLSTLFVVFSFYYLYEAIGFKNDDGKILQKKIFLSVIFSFLAFSNFPLNIFSLINIPIMAFFFWGHPDLKKKIIKYVFIGLLFFVFITLLNFGGIKGQILSIFSPRYHPIFDEFPAKISVVKSFLLNFEKFFLLFPLPILVLALVIKNKIKNKNLFAISLAYFLTYYFLISAVAVWTDNLREYLRYLFPLGFFFVFLIASFNIRFLRAFYLISFVSLVYFTLTIYYLSVPSTYNLAYDWLFGNLNNNDTVIINNVDHLQLPKNKDSYLLEDEKYCSIRCRNVIDSGSNGYIRPLIADQFSKKGIIFKARNIYYIEGKKQDAPDRELIKSFTNNIDDAIYYSPDYNIGSYFDSDYFKIKNLGKNIYIYKKI